MDKLAAEIRLNEFYIQCVDNFTKNSVFVFDRSRSYPPLIQYQFVDDDYKRDFKMFNCTIIWN